MENRRVFARRPCKLTAQFSHRDETRVGEVRDIGLGGLLAWHNSSCFAAGQTVSVNPTGETPLEYEVCWVEPSGTGFELGLRYPHSMAEFWDSWAADLLAGARPTQAEVLERRSQVRLECLLEGTLRTGDRDLVVDVLDIGGGGALIEMDHRLDQSSSLELTLETPVRVGNIPCSVARSWPGEPALYGVEFRNLKERHHVGLLRLLEHLFRQQR